MRNNTVCLVVFLVGSSLAASALEYKVVFVASL